MAKYIDADLLREGLKELESVIHSEQLLGQSMERYDRGQLHAVNSVRELLNSLQQEQPSEDLEKEQERNLDFQCFAKEMDSVFALPAPEITNTKDEPLNWEYAIARHFANWQKEQMLKDAVEGVVHHYGISHYVKTNREQLTESLKRFKDEEKVKIVVIAIKEDK